MRRKQMMVVLLVVMILVVSACQKVVREGDLMTGEEDDHSPVTTSMLTGSPGSQTETLGSGIAYSLNESFPGSIIQNIPGFNTSNAIRLQEGEAEFAIFLSATMRDAYLGKGIFDEPLMNLRRVAYFFESVYLMVLLEEVGATSFEDIIENQVPLRISTGPAGGLSKEIFIRLLDAYGLTMEDMESWGCRFYEKSLSESVGMMRDGMLDGSITLAPNPNARITEASANLDFVLITYDDVILEQLSQEHGYLIYTISGGTYDFYPDDYHCVATMITLAASASASEDKVYKVTRAIHENEEYMRVLMPGLREFDLIKMVAGDSIPLHPGAEKFYEDMGVLQ